MFGSLSETYNDLSIGLPEQFKSAKISRGENYLGLPYVMLDYPREFDKRDTLAIRTFFWWGNFFSITLQLAGTYQQMYAAKVQEAIGKGLLNEWFITSSDNAWHHRFEDGYYTSINNGEDYKLSQLPFIKVATRISLQNWNEAEGFLNKNFALLIEVLK